MIRYLQLDQRFSVPKMQQELARLEDANWQSHYNTAHYVGSWTVLPLRSLNGRSDNIISLHDTGITGTARYEDTELLKQSPYLSAVLASFECEKTSVRLMKLNAGAVIKNHRDQELCFEEGEVRFHIPVRTNYQVGFFLEEERIIMQEGECWYLNLTLKHRVQNLGKTDRVHLVVDCKVNDWIRHQFERNTLVSDVASDETSPSQSHSDKLKIISELRRMNTSISIEMADKMEEELHQS